MVQNYKKVDARKINFRLVIHKYQPDLFIHEAVTRRAGDEKIKRDALTDHSKNYGVNYFYKAFFITSSFYLF